MELKEFIKQSLVEIIDGVVEAQAYAKQKGARINPQRSKSQSSIVTDAWGAIGQDVEFDVAVVSNESVGGEIKTGISVIGIGIGGQASSDRSNATQNRIKFSVPLFLPIQKAE